MILIRVAFITLMEQKILGSIQIRVGPNKVGYWGLLQPFADAVKLLNKENMLLKAGNVLLYYLAPLLRLVLRLFLWCLYPILKGGYRFELGVLFFICVRGLGVFPLLIARWASNCKYSMLGGLRAVAQIISYEVRLILVLLRFIWMCSRFQLSSIIGCQKGNLFLFCCFPLRYIWFAASLAETHRTPYDFAESERELVSGFNTEYRARGFVLVFMAEYSRIIFISTLFAVFFLSGLIDSLVFVKGVIVRFLFIWVRGTIPRYRYDKLINLAWKAFLPVRLFFLIYCVRI